ncbi:MAG: hypothetical protein LBR68_06695 [Lachnoclostridium sp.]|nr:hypothetical protein [Lachnoclostridium sp.]
MAKNEKPQNTYSVKYWRGERLPRIVIRLDADYLMFRIENSRTDIQQSAYIRRKSLPVNIFQDPESVAAQTAQREILLEMINSKGKDLYEDLKKRKQEDPCIITYDGYLVNGNRRTAVLKDLNEPYVECVVLPRDATTKDIYALEQQLQISQDFREDYHWINELKNIRRGKDELRFTDTELTNNLRLSGIPELKTKLRTLDLIDAFLLWKNIPGEYDYSKLDDTEEIFRQLEKATKKYGKDAIKREKLQNSVFTLIEHRPAAGRLYGHVMNLIKDFDKVYKKATQDDASVDDTSPSYDTVSNTNSGLLFELVDSNSAPDIFSDPENAAENAGKLMEAIEDVKAENKERRDTEAVYEGVSTALRELQGLVIDQETAKLGTVINKLNEIIKISTQLLKDSERLRK